MLRKISEGCLGLDSEKSCRFFLIFFFFLVKVPWILGCINGKEHKCQCRKHKRHGFDPWVGEIARGGNGNPLQYSSLENPMDRGGQQTIRLQRVKHDWSFLPQKLHGYERKQILSMCTPIPSSHIYGRHVLNPGHGFITVTISKSATEEL